MSDAPQSPVAPAEARCINHPDRATRVRCSSCDRPICPRCMRQSAVGMKCPDCARPSRRAANPGSKRYLAAAGAGTGVSALVGALIGTGFIRSMGGLGILMPLLAGWVVGEIVSKMARRLGGTAFQLIAAGSTVVGLALGLMAVGGSAPAILSGPLLIFTLVAAVVAAVRVGR